MFPMVIDKIRPKVIIEVGTWLGASALYMARLLKERKIEGTIICVDTWLGSLEHFMEPELREYTRRKNGYPQLYPQFLANVIFENMQETIVPVPLTSHQASRFLLKKGIIADMIYIDSGHEEAEVCADINDYWELLRDGGVLIGDDYSESSWPGVFNAANRFARERGVDLFPGGGKFLIEKRAPR